MAIARALFRDHREKNYESVKIQEDFTRFETAQEKMNTGNLLAARKITTMNKSKKHKFLCSQT